MKIICSFCKTALGEQEPFDNPAEIKAKCVACITKEQEEASRFIFEPKPGQTQDVDFDNGLKGVLWIAQDKEDKLFIGELAVSGKKFFCSKYGRKEFQNYLERLAVEEADVTFLHSITCKLEPPQRGRKKKQDLPKIEESKKDDSIQYNCTMKAPKYLIGHMFDDMAERMDRVTEILANGALKIWKEEQFKSMVENTDSSSMSGVLSRTNSNDLTSKEIGDS